MHQPKAHYEHPSIGRRHTLVEDASRRMRFAQHCPSHLSSKRKPVPVQSSLDRVEIERLRSRMGPFACNRTVSIDIKACSSHALARQRLSRFLIRRISEKKKNKL